MASIARSLTPLPTLPLKGGGAHPGRIENPPPPLRGREGWGEAAARRRRC
jgi:hypothetical protein